MASDNSPPGIKTPADTTDVQTDDTGAARAGFGAAVAAGDVEVAPAEADAFDLGVEAEFLDDEPSWVHLSGSLDAAYVRFSLRPSEARQLAAKLQSAAAFAEADR